MAPTASAVFASVFPPQLVHYQGRHVVVDRAHNLWLDLGMLSHITVSTTAATIGWPARGESTNGGYGRSSNGIAIRTASDTGNPLKAPMGCGEFAVGLTGLPHQSIM